MNANDHALPAISVVMRSGGERSRMASFKRAVRSILSQTDVNVNVIVAFNGSACDPRLIEWARLQPRTRCVVLGGADKPGATLIGRVLVTGEFFCFLDDDDELLPGTLAYRAALMHKHADAACVATNGYYVVNGKRRRLFEDPERFRRSGYARSLVESNNWLASCGGMFRTDLVSSAYFRELPPHREWTVVAFRLASRLKVQFEDTPTYCIYDTESSESKKESYMRHAVEICEDMLRWNTDPRHVSMILRRQGHAYRAMCSHYRLNNDFPRAWQAYWKAIRSQGGWTHIPYAVLLLLRSTRPAAHFSLKFAARSKNPLPAQGLSP